MELFYFIERPDYILACKLRALKSTLKKWRKTEQGNLNSQRKKLLGQMGELDSVLGDRAVTDEEIMK